MSCDGSDTRTSTWYFGWWGDGSGAPADSTYVARVEALTTAAIKDNGGCLGNCWACSITIDSSEVGVVGQVTWDDTKTTATYAPYTGSQGSCGNPTNDNITNNQLVLDSTCSSMNAETGYGAPNVCTSNLVEDPDSAMYQWNCGSGGGECLPAECGTCKHQGNAFGCSTTSDASDRAYLSCFQPYNPTTSSRLYGGADVLDAYMKASSTTDIGDSPWGVCAECVGDSSSECRFAWDFDGTRATFHADAFAAAQACNSAHACPTDPSGRRMGCFYPRSAAVCTTDGMCNAGYGGTVDPSLPSNTAAISTQNVCGCPNPVVMPPTENLTCTGDVDASYQCLCNPNGNSGCTVPTETACIDRDYKNCTTDDGLCVKSESIPCGQLTWKYTGVNTGACPSSAAGQCNTLTSTTQRWSQSETVGSPVCGECRQDSDCGDAGGDGEYGLRCNMMQGYVDPTSGVRIPPLGYCSYAAADPETGKLPMAGMTMCAASTYASNADKEKDAPVGLVESCADRYNISYGAHSSQDWSYLDCMKFIEQAPMAYPGQDDSRSVMGVCVGDVEPFTAACVTSDTVGVCVRDGDGGCGQCNNTAKQDTSTKQKCDAASSGCEANGQDGCTFSPVCNSDNAIPCVNGYETELCPNRNACTSNEDCKYYRDDNGRPVRGTAPDESTGWTTRCQPLLQNQKCLNHLKENDSGGLTNSLACRGALTPTGSNNTITEVCYNNEGYNNENLSGALCSYGGDNSKDCIPDDVHCVYDSDALDLGIVDVSKKGTVGFGRGYSDNTGAIPDNCSMYANCTDNNSSSVFTPYMVEFGTCSSGGVCSSGGGSCTTDADCFQNIYDTRSDQGYSGYKIPSTMNWSPCLSNANASGATFPLNWPGSGAGDAEVKKGCGKSYGDSAVAEEFVLYKNNFPTVSRAYYTKGTDFLCVDDATNTPDCDAGPTFKAFGSWTMPGSMARDSQCGAYCGPGNNTTDSSNASCYGGSTGTFSLRTDKDDPDSTVDINLGCFMRSVGTDQEQMAAASGDEWLDTCCGKGANCKSIDGGDGNCGKWTSGVYDKTSANKCRKHYRETDDGKYYECRYDMDTSFNWDCYKGGQCLPSTLVPMSWKDVDGAYKGTLDFENACVANQTSSPRYDASGKVIDFEWTCDNTSNVGTCDSSNVCTDSGIACSDDADCRWKNAFS